MFLNYTRLNTKTRKNLTLISFKAELIKSKGTELNYPAELSKINYIVIRYSKIPNHV